MSSKDLLVEERQLHGVRYEGLLDVADYVRGVTYRKSDELAEGPITVLRANNITLESSTLNFDDVRTVSSSVKVRAEQWLLDGDILMCSASGSTQHVGKVAYVSGSLNHTFGGFMAVLRAGKLISPRFLFHVLRSARFEAFLMENLTSTTINNINSALLSGFKVPIPTIAIQNEIVRILDTFTSLETELEAELGARTKQYAHFRNQLIHSESTEVGSKKIGSLVSVVRSKAPIPRSQYQSTGKFPVIDQGQSYIAGWTNNEEAILPEGQYVIFGDHTRSLKYVDFPFAQGADGLQILRANEAVNPRYLFHVMAATPLPNRGYNRHWTLVREIEVPLPSMEKQSRIVSTLDKFDALVSDNSFGLPAELEARRKQYAHYRDQLLSFKEA